MSRSLSAILCASLLACTSGAPDAATSATSKEPAVEVSPAAAACPEKVAAMRALFAHGPGEPPLVEVPPGMELPTSSAGEEVAAVPVLLLADGGYRFGERSQPTLAELRAALDEELEREKTLKERLGEPFQPSLALVADARVPAARIVELVGALAPEVTLYQVVHLAGDAVPPAPPMPASVQRVLEEVRADHRAMELAKLLEAAIGSCRPIAEVFEKLATSDVASRGKTLLDSLPGAVEACKCEGIDLEVLVPAVWAMSGKTSPSKRQLRLALSSDAAAEQVKLPANATAADLARLLETRGATPFRVVLEG